MSRHIEHESLSMAWGQALRLITARGRSEEPALTVAITGFDADGVVREDAAIRTALDSVLATRRHQSVATVANTIFPQSLWNPDRPRQQLFGRYMNLLPRLKRVRANKRGLYFERMISGGPPGRENQLEFALSTFSARSGVRRSVLQLGLFQPAKDHSAAAMVGFPCLQHVTFAPTRAGLYVNAFYATQYMVERAYGNYLGLCRLGRFVAHELGLRLAQLTCFVGIAERDGSLKGLARVLKAVDDRMQAEEEA